MDWQRDRVQAHRQLGVASRITWRRAVVTLLVVLMATAVAIGAEPVRSSVLRTAGWALVAEDPLAPADVIVIPAAGSAASILETAEMVHRGIATRVALFADPPDDVDREFIRRGIAYEDSVAIAMRQLESLGIDAVERIPKSIAGTEEEARMLAGWCGRRQVHSVVVISTADHSRRLRRAFNRAVEGHDIKVSVRVTRYSPFNPDRWWQTRDGTRTGIIELQKLLLDILIHPMS
jgi:uncharacterized SAM-binding protein YcdF (DUF218 family)